MSINLERSLKDRIKAIAKIENRTFNDVWKSLVMERILARFARSRDLNNFIFKGGFLLSKYICLGRETTDLDFSLTEITWTVSSIKALINEILFQQHNDGFSFEGLEVQEMRHPHMNHPGFEVTAIACLGQTRTMIRIDLGVGDKVAPEKKSITLLSLKDKPLFESEIFIQVYPLSYIFAEKLETVVYRGGTNSRMKDFYDIFVISQLPNFDCKFDLDVVQAVFKYRRTVMLSKLTYDDKAIVTLNRNWKRFIGTLEEDFQQNVPTEFSEVIEKIDQILTVL